MFCTACGSPNPDDARFCARCGRSVDQSPPAPLPNASDPISAAQVPPDAPPSVAPSAPPSAVPATALPQTPASRRSRRLVLVAALALCVVLPLGTWIWLRIHRESVRVLKGHHSYVGTVLFTNDSRMVVSGSEDGTIRLWDVATGSSLRTMDSRDGCYWLALAPDGRLLAATGGPSGTNPHAIVLWDLATGRRFKTLTEPEEYVGVPVFNPGSSQTLATSSHVWNIASGAEVRAYPDHSIYAFSADQRVVVALGPGKTVDVLDRESGKPIHTFTVDSFFEQSLSLSPDGRLLAGVAGEKRIAIWDVTTGQTLRTLTARSGLRVIQFDRDGLALASGGDEGTIEFWETGTGQLLRTLPGHKGGTNTLAFSPDGQWLASGGADGIVRVWPLKTSN